MEKYKDKTIDIEIRIEDLLQRMSLKEKVGQLNQRMYGWKSYQKSNGSFTLTEELKKEVEWGCGIGALYGVFRADPWSKVTYENGIESKDRPKVANMIQRYVIEHQPHGIPAMFCEECPHGHQALDSTIFPVNIGIGSTWNPLLYEQITGCIAEELRASGVHVGFISALDMLRDPRWGRSEECYSEDPYLASHFAAAAVRGMQGKSISELTTDHKVIALLKHFCAQGNCVGGHNSGEAIIGERELREIHLPSMKACVKEGALGCMAAYNEIDGVSCHANQKLLTGILRNEWGFNGFVMSDGCGNDRLIKQTNDAELAGAMALKAGVDIGLWDKAFSSLENAVNNNKTNLVYINRAVRRVLRIKFLLGLFDNPYTEENIAIKIGSKKNHEIALKAARESIVLLKNDNGLLPFKKNIKKIAVIGPNANQLYNQLGDYTPTQKVESGKTVFQGIRDLASDNVKISYAKGCDILDKSLNGFEEALSIARNSDVAVIVVGGSSARNFDFKFAENGAPLVTDNSYNMDCGEGYDRADLELGGVQLDLVKAVQATDTPTVVILIQGRPHAVKWISQNCDAVLCAWYPGIEGGTAIAEILFGITNPSGKLPVSIPRSSSQLPVYYNHKDTEGERCYIDMSGKALYPFGYGLSYTNFQYKNLRVNCNCLNKEEIEKGKTFDIHIDVINTGNYPGYEVVQLYIKDLESSVTRRVKELKGFQKVWIDTGKTETVTFRLGFEELAVWDINMDFTLEPGHVQIIIVDNIVEQTLLIK